MFELSKLLNNTKKQKLKKNINKIIKILFFI